MSKAQEELDLLVSHAQLGHCTLVAIMEVVAMMMHDKMSPTNWLTLTTEQRNNGRKRANLLVNDALAYWDNEVRKRNAEN